MYTHIGNGNILKNKNIIGIFDIKTIEASRNNLRIQYKIKENKLSGKSVIVKETNDGKFDEEVSEIAVLTLKKRFEKGI